MWRRASPFSVVHRPAGEGRGILGHPATVHVTLQKNAQGLHSWFADTILTGWLFFLIIGTMIGVWEERPRGA